MGDGEVQVLAHAVVPVVLMAASSADDDSGGSTWGAVKDVGSGAAWNAAQAHRDEVLSEYTGDDVSEDDYQQELETTANEATKHDYAFVPEGEYGDKIASYLQDNAPDVEIERYSVPGDKKDDAGLEGTSNNLSYRQKKEMFPNYRHPSSAVRKQQRQAKEEYENAGVIGKAGRIFARMGETEDSFATAPDYRSWKSENPPYADTDFVTVEGGPGGDEGGDSSGSGLGSSHEDTDYGGEVVDEFMSTGFNEYAKVETEDGDIKYFKNGEEIKDNGQQAYAGASAHRPEDPPGAESDTDDIPDVDHDEYGTLLNRLQDVHRDDGSALVVTDKTYQDDIENALDDGGFDYTAKDAL